MKLLVISPAHQTQLDRAEPMIRTARRVGLEPLMYGLQSSHPHGKDYQGSDIVRILGERTNAEIVMGVDAPDVAFLTGEAEILEKFSTFKHPFVMSTEHDGVCGLRRTYAELNKQCPMGGWDKPNMGGWIGERSYTLACFSEAERLYAGKPEDPENPYDYDNHYQWLTMMKAWGGGLEFDLDWHSVLFQSMNKAHVEWSSKRAFNKVTGTMPCVVHYNGDPTRGAYGEAVRNLLLED